MSAPRTGLDVSSLSESLETIASKSCWARAGSAGRIFQQHTSQIQVFNVQLAMTDSPVMRIPLDPREQPILDKLLAVRTNLELLQQDKSTYVKSQDVINLYNQVIEQVVVLNELRTNKRHEQNRGVVS